MLATLATGRRLIYDPRLFLPKAVSGKRSAVLSLSGRSERASYLTPVLARKTESGLPPVTYSGRGGYPIPCLEFLSIIKLLAASGP